MDMKTLLKMIIGIGICKLANLKIDKQMKHCKSEILSRLASENERLHSHHAFIFAQTCLLAAGTSSKAFHRAD